MDAKNGWELYRELLPSWFASYFDLEQRASHIRSHDAEYVPGLFQTADCARSIIETVHSETGDLDRRVDLRIHRQRLLAADNGPIIHALIRESVLELPGLSTRQRREQLDRLIELAARPRITVQVLPTGSADRAETFSILGVPAADPSDVVYLEQPDRADYLSDATDVARYSALLDRLCGQAEPAEQTPDILRRVRARTSA